MSKQGGDWTDKLISEAIGQPTQHQIETVTEILARAAREIRREAAWPSREHLFRPAEYLVEGRQWEEYVYGLLVPVRGPVDLWRQAAKRARDHSDEG